MQDTDTSIRHFKFGGFSANIFLGVLQQLRRDGALKNSAEGPKEISVDLFARKRINRLFRLAARYEISHVQMFDRMLRNEEKRFASAASRNANPAAKRYWAGLSKKERSARASKAAQARWGKKKKAAPKSGH